MEKRGQAKRLETLGMRILNASRTELTLAMRYLASPLHALGYVMDLTTPSVGTDASFIRFNPNYLRLLYIEQPSTLNRTYLHMLLHCLYGHMFAAPRFEDAALWDLCADIAVEAVIDSMDAAPVLRVTSDYRTSVYETLGREVRVLTAERLYRHLAGRERDYEEEERRMREFHADDHVFWSRLADDNDQPRDEKEQTPLPQHMLHGQMRLLKDAWEKEAARVKSETDLLSKEASKETGHLAWTLRVTGERRTDFRTYLRRFAVVREDAHPDPDQFDMGLYNYGLSLYGNLPLIEELEVREAKKTDELVIAIDTSASCARELVQTFLNETARILGQQESFFHRVDVRIIECDDRVQEEIAIRDVRDIRHYTERFTMKGGFGTDFRPVFSHVHTLREKGELSHLRGLLYFTDGYGIYPKKAPPYDVAFVFDRDRDNNEREVPAWAMKLYI